MLWLPRAVALQLGHRTLHFYANSDKVISSKLNYAKGVVLFSIIFSGETQLLLAEERGDVHPYLTETFTLDLGVYFPDRKLRIGVDSPAGGPNDAIDFQNGFGHQRSDDVFSLNFGWRFGEKWQLGIQYFESSGVDEAVLEEDVEWDDLVFGQGSSVVTGQNFTLARVFFARNFATREHHDFGVGAGFHWLELGASIDGNITGGGGDTFRSESVSASAPLPNIGVWYVYSISPSWALKGRFDWMSANVGDYDGSLINTSLGVNYQMFENAGIGLSFNLFDLDVGVRNSGWKGRWNTSYEGLYAYVSFFW